MYVFGLTNAYIIIAPDSDTLVTCGQAGTQLLDPDGPIQSKAAAVPVKGFDTDRKAACDSTVFGSPSSNFFYKTCSYS